MSEEEKIKRFGYRQVRKNRIKVLTVMLSIFAALTIILSSIAIAFNKTYYVNYTETSSVKYGVHLKDNTFYEKDYLDEGFAYIASLIDKVETSFKYGILMDTSKDVEFKYTYRIDSVLQIKDRGTGKLLYAPVYNEFAESSGIIVGRDVNLKQTVQIDYEKYDQMAKSFISTYQLRDVAASLQVQMHVNVVGASEEFHASESATTYVSSISIPLATNTLSINITSAPPANNQKILSYTTAGVALVFRNTAFALGAVTLLVGLALLIYTYVSRNQDITYDIKVQRLVSAYKSFIQKINNTFNTNGYQVLYVDTFTEMLEIRDTIQAPILMNENEDKTKTSFLIPTNTSILYVFEIKVDDYDELYGKSDDNGSRIDYSMFNFDFDDEASADAPIPDDAEDTSDGGEDVSADYNPASDDSDENSSEDSDENASDDSAPDSEPMPVAEAEPEANGDAKDSDNTAEENSAEESAEPVNASETIAAEDDTAENTKIINISDDNSIHISDDMLKSIEEEGSEDFRVINGEVVHIRYRTSFTSRLIQSGDKLQDYYTALKNALLSYKGVKARVSFAFESYNKGRLQCAKLNVKGSAVRLYLALNPTEYNADKYRFTDVTGKPKVSDVPMLLKVKSDRSLKYALELIDEFMNKNGIAKGTAPTESYRMPYETNEQLADRNLVKIILPKGIVIDENTVIKKINISELMKSHRAESEAKAEALK